MTEQINAAQEQVRMALEQIDEIPTDVEQRTRSVSSIVFKEKAIATVEKNIRAVPLSKSGEVAEKIGKMAALRRSGEEDVAKKPWGWIVLAIDRCINLLTGHGPVTTSEWAQHVADDLRSQHAKIALIQQHFRTVKEGKSLLPDKIQSAIAKLSPDEIKKLVQENVFNIERLQDLGLYKKFEETMPFILTGAEKTAFAKALALRGPSSVDDASAQEKRLEQALENGDLVYAQLLLNKLPSVGGAALDKALRSDNIDVLRLVLASSKLRDINETF